MMNSNIKIIKYKFFVFLAKIFGRKRFLYNPRVLTYHNISDDNNDRFTVKINEFEKQIKLLNDLNYRSECIGEIFKSKYNNLNDKIVYITFDDGCKGAYKNALPILIKYGFKATFFISTNYISSESNQHYINWDEIRRLIKYGFKIGLHSHYHKMLSKLSINELTSDIMMSKNIFYNQLGFNTNLFSFPFGKKNSFNEIIIEKLKDEGFEYVFTQINGCILKNTSQYQIPRNNISGMDNINIFKMKLNGNFDIYKHLIRIP